MCHCTSKTMAQVASVARGWLVAVAKLVVVAWEGVRGKEEGVD